MTERAFVRSLHRVGFDAVTVRERRPFGVDDCARYPLFDDDLVALMRRVIQPERQERIATAVVVTAVKPTTGDVTTGDLIASTSKSNGAGALNVITVMGEPRTSLIFDAGDRHCGDGLQGQLRAWWAGLPPGTRTKVRLRDPSAKADAPALARLLGHTIEAETHEDGVLTVAVRTALK